MRRLFLFGITIFLLSGMAMASRLVFSNEQAQTKLNGSFVIDVQDYETNIELKFGNSIDASIVFERIEDEFVINRAVNFGGNELQNFRLEKLPAPPVCDASQLGRAYFNVTDNFSYSCNGSIWRRLENVGGGSAVHPFLDAAVLSIPASTTNNISVFGNSFSVDSLVTIPGFDGTVNSVSIISPTQIDLSLTAGTTETSYNVIVDNNGALNTSWANNGVGKIVVVSANDGAGSAAPGISCKELFDNGHSVGDGNYWIDPNGGSVTDSFQVYCDMNNGGWTRVDYAADLPHQAQFGGGDANRWLPNNFSFVFTNTQINDLRAVSTTAKQRYVGSCEGVIHHLYQANNYAYAFGFRFMDGHETNFGQELYPSSNVVVSNDQCVANTNNVLSTTFDITDIRLPIINVHSRDNSSTEEFGSELTQNPAWFK